MKTLKEFIGFYENIPDSKWTTQAYIRGAKCCALGHLGSREGLPYSRTRSILEHLITIKTGKIDRLVDVNDNESTAQFPTYQLGDTPKERVLNYLTMVETGLMSEYVEAMKEDTYVI